MPYRILLVEDSRADIELTKFAFGELNTLTEITVANDGVEALEILDRQRTANDGNYPDLIILDLGLPRMNGHEVLRHVKSNKEHEHLPVIVMSTTDQNGDIHRCYQLHASSFISKPVGMDAYRKIARTIEKYWLDSVTLPSC